MKVLITGASSGIGEAYAERFARMGYDLILTGRRERLLEAISGRIQEKYHIEVETLTIELTNDAEVDNLAERIRETGDLDVLVNNAGFGSRLNFVDDDYRNQESMIKVHVLVPLKLMHAVLPGMIRRGGGIIINVSSLGIKTPIPTGSVYNATKSFLRMISESLYLENNRSHILFQALCPGFTRTDFHGRLGYINSALKNKGIIRWMSPEEVVEISLRNLKKDKVVCVPGFWNKVLWVMADLIPRKLYYRIVTLQGKREAFYRTDKVINASA